MEMSEIKIITHKDDEIRKLREYQENQEKEIQFLRGILGDFLTAFTNELGEVCYCKKCNVALIDRRSYACEFYDEEKPRPSLLCILSKLVDNSMLIHRERVNYILPALRRVEESFNSGNSVCLRDVIEECAPGIIYHMKRLEGVNSEQDNQEN